MKHETKVILKRTVKTAFVSAFAAYALAILAVIASPTFWDGTLELSYIGTITAVIAPLLCVPIYLYYARKDYKAKTLGR